MKKCKYYIMYPKNHNDKVEVKCLVNPPKEKMYSSVGFVEGGYKTKKEAINRLNWMNIPESKRKF